MKSVSVNCVLNHCTKVNSLLLRRNLTSITFSGQLEFNELNETDPKIHDKLWRTYLTLTCKEKTSRNSHNEVQ